MATRSKGEASRNRRCSHHVDPPPPESAGCEAALRDFLPNATLLRSDRKIGMAQRIPFQHRRLVIDQCQPYSERIVEARTDRWPRVVGAPHS